jgi:hypothetical protein
MASGQDVPYERDLGPNTPANVNTFARKTQLEGEERNILKPTVKNNNTSRLPQEQQDQPGSADHDNTAMDIDVAIIHLHPDHRHDRHTKGSCRGHKACFQHEATCHARPLRSIRQARKWVLHRRQRTVYAHSCQGLCEACARQT